jgi:hypothetical protein
MLLVACKEKGVPSSVAGRWSVANETLERICWHTRWPGKEHHAGANKFKASRLIHNVTTYFAPLIRLIRNNGYVGLLPPEWPVDMFASNANYVESFLLAFSSKAYRHTLEANVRCPNLGLGTPPFRQKRWMIFRCDYCFHGLTNPVPFHIIGWPLWIKVVVWRRPGVLRIINALSFIREESSKPTGHRRNQAADHAS